MIEKIICKNTLLAIIIGNSHCKEGIEFFTDNDFSQQLGYMNRSEGYIIPPHKHNLIERKVMFTQEVLYIKSGKVRVDFYDLEQNYFESRLLLPGDVILLASGGHGFKMLESTEMIEVKQGPFCGDKDKVHFKMIAEENIKFGNNGC